MRGRGVACALAAAAALQLLHAVAERLDTVSFSPPFEQHDGTGTRIISPGWVTDGVAKVAKNFVRLTPDRASKKGAAWSKSPIGRREVTVVVEFRISGKGRRLYGDGLAVWLAQPYRVHDPAWDDDFYFAGDEMYDDHMGEHNPYHSWNEWPLGDFHAFEPDFKGVGVIFDTYPNHDMPEHKDVTVVVNDRNTTDAKELLVRSHGCMSLVRWFEGRDDFHAGKVSSKAKLVLTEGQLTVLVDPKSIGDWQECAKVPLDLLEPEWLEAAHVGVTASTGDLADNHDLIRVDVYSDEVSAKKGEEWRAAKGHDLADSRLAPAAKQTADGGAEGGEDAPAAAAPVPVEQMTHQERITRLETYLNVMLVKLELVEHHMEHEMIDLAQTSRESEAALKQQEDRIELAVKDLAEKVAAAEARLQELVEQGMVAATDRAKGWRIPVLFLGIFLVGCAIAAAMGWRKLRKTHLL